jgi:hypothetical protein
MTADFHPPKLAGDKPHRSPHEVFKNMATMKSPGMKNTPLARSQTLAMVTFESAGIAHPSTSGTPTSMMRRYAALALMTINVPTSWLAMVE